MSHAVHHFRSLDGNAVVATAFSRRDQWVAKYGTTASLSGLVGWGWGGTSKTILAFSLDSNATVAIVAIIMVMDQRDNDGTRGGNNSSRDDANKQNIDQMVGVNEVGGWGEWFLPVL